MSFSSYFFKLFYLQILLITLFTKVVLVNTHFIQNNETLYYRIIQSLAHDSIILFSIILLVYISYFSRLKNIFSFILRFLASFIFIIYIIDVIILNEFATHLTIDDTIKYFAYVIDYIQQLYVLNLWTMLIIFLIILIFIYFIIKKHPIKSKFEHKIFLSILLVLFLLNTFSENGRFIHSWLFKNVVEYNYEILSQSKNYSSKFIKSMNYQEKVICTNKKSLDLNMIILMVESLASYQSNYFSGIKNWTPNLDFIAKENTSFKNFFANGFVTEDAEISILTGDFPLYAPNSYSNGGGVSFSGFYNIKYSLPYILKEKGYHNEFITSSDLNFSNTGNWAKSIGFNYIEGSEHLDYANKQRYHFNAAADEFLYSRVIKRIKKQKSKYFMFIKTVSSHAPFINPENFSNSEEETIKYVDKQIGIFYKKLKKLDFFNNGILIIVGDHHPVIPLKKEEISKFGIIKASSLVPMILVEKNKKKTIEEFYQQTDIYNSIKNYVSTEKCVSNWKGDFISTNDLRTSKFIIHRRGDERGLVSVFNKDQYFNVKLNGDNTSVIESDLKNEEMINKINATRIIRLNDKYNYNENN